MIRRPILVVALLWATCAWADDAPPLSGKDVQVTLKKRSASRFTPEKTDGPREAKAVVLCTIGQRGDLIDCEVQSETPSGYGYGRATVQVATEVMRIAPKAKDGSPTAGRKFVLPMTFKSR